MKKKLSIICALFTSLALFGACQGGASTASSTSSASSASSAASGSSSVSVSSTTAGSSSVSDTDSDLTVRIAALKGPTTMGLLHLLSENDAKTAAQNYDFTMVTAADEVVASMAKNELDIALIPANMSSILYQKTNSGISVIDINTLGVLYLVSADNTISDIPSLKGKTVVLTGKGTTPDYCLQYLLNKNGLSASDVTLEYKSEATEVVSDITADPAKIGLLPQPFATTAQMQNDALKTVCDLTAEWDKVSTDSTLVTGVTVVDNDFLAAHPEAVNTFLEEHKSSSAYATEHVEETADLVVSAGIIEKAPVAVSAIPYCNITYIDGTAMKEKLSGYLQALYDLDPATIGGQMPGEDFYYVQK
ncbi:MAG: ABC transporter substrate-binding protein [Lachnospiraceae bacterium]|nr:ABC transporter substrate-binding protein [Lachnospiraceae bacterium]